MDGLANNQVISGVGGQFDFVDMAQKLDDGRSIILIRATRQSSGGVESNVVWNYGHITIPRHLRDIVVTEYGVADLRDRVLATPARDLADLEARLVVIRDLVSQLGTGYLLDLVTATLEDVRAMRSDAEGER